MNTLQTGALTFQLIVTLKEMEMVLGLLIFYSLLPQEGQDRV